ncbi:beta-class phenol-soluble modulin [Apibacter muscae]|uniref:Beta-class phenol-soluble modulin n=1 Tax=Apibacter muscae TaxID=2509004 RepID=A0A563DIZ3_9FLAO|nr:beta-class phenol-soluble modulin [Apibacter muscae]TWP29843.1 beta-class phenol-soluble modulin [Apibacter muscae]TWP30992.1 beta-class phenol-soluble modulin [Apibacter muscae]
MKNLQNLTNQELKEINGGGLAADLANNVQGIVSNAIDKNWSDMAKSIVETSTTGLKLVGSFFGKFFGR